MKKPLTKRQTEIFIYVRERTKENGYVLPEDMIEHFKTSQSNVHRFLLVLGKKGWVSKDETHYPVIYKAK